MKKHLNWIASSLIILLMAGVVSLACVTHGQAKQIDGLNKNILKFSEQWNEAQKITDEYKQKFEEQKKQAETYQEQLSEHQQKLDALNQKLENEQSQLEEVKKKTNF